MILLDTHALIFWANQPDDLGSEARRKIQQTARIGVHVISCFEIAILVEKEKIVLDQPVEDWLSAALSHPKTEVVPLTVRTAVQCTQLPGEFHRDPADRMLAATCLLNDIPLITKDKLIIEWGHITTIW